MYSREERLRAVGLYIEYGRCATDAIRELGYPASRKSVYAWYGEYLQEPEAGTCIDPHERMKKHTFGQKQASVDHCLGHGRSVSRTIKAMGYPGKQVLTGWIDEPAPGMRKTDNSLRCPYEQKKAAAVDLCTRKRPAKGIASEHGIDGDAPYRWKKKLLRKGACAAGDKIPEEPPEGVDGLKAIAASSQDGIFRLKPEADILEGTAGSLKKDRSADPAPPTNREKAIPIGALREVYPPKALPDAPGTAMSSYFCRARAMAVPGKHGKARCRIIGILHENEGRYGYRPMHAALKQEDRTVSEKAVRGIMAEEQLAARRKDTEKHSSHAGEATPAPDDAVARGFHAEDPDEKRPTGMTGFAVPAGKAHLPPPIGRFDGMAASWTTGASPTAETADSMPRGAVPALSEGGRPPARPDRGGHYRRPGRMKTMEEAGLARSMSKKGCSPDNSACGGFFGRTKLEFFYGRDRQGVAIAEFIDMLDSHLHRSNERRTKKSLGWMSPLNYRKSLGGMLPFSGHRKPSI